MSNFCARCKFCKICPVTNDFWKAVKDAVSLEGYNRLEELLFNECQYKVDKASITKPLEKY